MGIENLGEHQENKEVSKEEAKKKFSEVKNKIDIAVHWLGEGMTYEEHNKLGSVGNIPIYKDNPNKKNDGIPEIRGNLRSGMTNITSTSDTEYIEIKREDGSFYRLELQYPGETFKLLGRDGKYSEDMEDLSPDKVINDCLPRFEKRLNEAKARREDEDKVRLKRLEELSYQKDQEDIENIENLLSQI